MEEPSRTAWAGRGLRVGTRVHACARVCTRVHECARASQILLQCDKHVLTQRALKCVRLV